MLGGANRGFEADFAWIHPATPQTANYTGLEAHSGNRSMRHGVAPPQWDVYSHSSAYQKVTIPDDASSAILGFYLKPFSEDTTWSAAQLAGRDWSWYDPGAVLGGEKTVAEDASAAWSYTDWQEVLVLNADYRVVEVLWRQTSNARTWFYSEFDLTHYRGRTIYVYFNVYNNGNGSRTWMFVDRVSVRVCTGDAAGYGASLQGQVKLQGRDVHDRTLVAVDGSWCGSSDPLGLFDCALSEDDPASVEVTASREGYLTAKGLWTREGAPTPSGLSLPATVLAAGDADGDDTVGLLDLVLVGASYGTVPPSDPRADLNEDGQIDIFDLVLIGISYGLEGPTSWTGPAAAVTWAKASGQSEARVVAADAKDGAAVPPDGAERRPGDKRPGRLVRVALRLSGVKDLVAADVSYHFDPARFQVVDADPARPGVQVAAGDFLPEPRFVAANSADNTTGEIRFAATALRPAAGVTGSGVLAWVTFRVMDSDFQTAVAGLSLESAGATLVGASE